MDQNQTSPEMNPQNIEKLSSVEGLEKPVETQEVVKEEVKPIIENQPSALPVEQPQPVSPVDPAAQNPPVQGTSDLPNNTAIADDATGDKLEKPWVLKAENIMEKDKNNPFQEEVDFEDLQADYLKKRFGKDIKRVD